MVIPAPYQVRGKLQQESIFFMSKTCDWIPVCTGMTGQEMGWFI